MNFNILAFFYSRWSLSTLLANIYLNEVDKMLERAKEVTSEGGNTLIIKYARFADDLVILVSGYYKTHNDKKF